MKRSSLHFKKQFPFQKPVLLGFVFFLVTLGSFTQLFGATYTWQGANNALWTTSTNWNPTRTTPAATDILQFNTGTTLTITAVPTQTIGNFVMSNSTTITLQAATASSTLTIGNGTGTDLDVPSGSSLTIGTNVNVTLAASATANISGTLTVNSSRTYDTNGTTVVTTVNGTIINTGTVTCATATKLLFMSGSTYRHAQDAGTIPTATWDAASTCLITGVTSSTLPNGFSQNFGNVTWNCTGQASGNSLPNSDYTFSGTLTIVSTGTSTLQLVRGSYTGNVLNYVQTGGSVFMGSATTATKILNVTNAFSISGGTFDMCTGNPPGASTFTLNVGGNFTISGGTFQKSTAANATCNVNFNGTTTQTYSYTAGTLSGLINFSILSGATVDFGTSTISNGSSGTFTLNSGGSIITAHAQGLSTTAATGTIQVTGTKTYNAGANYTYDGTANQSTGNGLPTALTGKLTISNTGGAGNNTVTLSSAEAVANGGSIDLVAGIFASGTNLTMNAATSTINRSEGSMTGAIQGAGPSTYNVNYTGNSKTTGPELSGGGLNNIAVTLTAGQTLTLDAIRAPDGNVTINNGSTFDLSSFTLNRSAAGGTLTVASGATLRIGSTNTLPANYSTHSIGATSTIEYYGSAQTVANLNSAQTYGNLILSGSGTKTLQTGTTAISGNLTLSGTVSTTTVVGLTISGNLSIGDGTTFTAAGYALTVTGTTTVGGGTSGNLTISSATGAKLFTGLVTVNAGATWNNSGNSALEFRGGITTTPTFTGGSGVHTFTTNAQALTGTFSIPSVTVTTITLTNNNTLTVGTALTGTGGLTQAASATLNIGGTSTITTLTATNTGNTVNYTGAAQTIHSNNYYHLTLSGSGTDVLQTGTTTISGNLTLSGTVSTTTVVGLAISGNLSIGDGTTFTAAAYALTVTGTTTLGGGTSGTLTISSATGAKLFTGLVTVNAGATWNNSGNSALEFRGGITTTPTFTGGSGVHTFTTNAQALTGTFSIPSVTVTTITLTNNNTLTVGTALTGTGGLTQAASATLNIGGTSTITTLTATNTGNTVNYTGAAQAIAAVTYNNLTINQSSGNATLGGAATVNGTLTLTAGNLAVTDPNELTMGASATTVGAKDVTGIVTRTSFVAATSYTFGNQYTTINFQNVGTLPTVMKAKITIGSAPAWKTDAIQRTFEMIQSGASGSLASLNLHYLDTELNGNTEDKLVHWTAQLPSPPGDVMEHGRADYSTTNNWVGCSNMDVSYFPTAFGSIAWTLGNSALSSFTWNGSISIDWSTAANWTPVGNPSELNDAIIPDASTTPDDPTLPLGAAAIGRLTIESGGILNATTTSTVTISGASGAWSDNGGTFNASTSTVIFTNAAATVSGETEFYNVTINSGAGLTMGSGGTMRIGGTMTNNGTWRAAGLSGSTVEYNGGSQTVLNPNGLTPGYDNLILSGSGTKTMPGTALTIADNFTMSGTASATAGNTISMGAFNQTAGTFNDGGFTMTVTGSGASTWTKSGTYTASGTVNFTGTSPEIGASNFSTLQITVSGTATLTGNATVAGNLTISSGAINLSSFTANRTVAGGTLALANGTTMIIGGTNTIPTNYDTHSFGATSTVEYAGSTQTVAALNSSQNYGHLIFSNVGIKSISSSITANGNVTINSGAPVTVANSITLQVNGSISNAGTLTNNGTIKVGN